MILVVSGTGTGVGKTHVACAMLDVLAAGGDVVAWKPVESGVDPGTGGGLGADEALLQARSRVAVPSIRLPAPLSPHLAARRAGVRLDPAALHGTLSALAAAWPTVVVELAGGLCSPFCDELDAAEWLAAAAPAVRARLRLVLVAPDRLGVLHDVSATVRSATALGLAVDGVVLSPPAAADLSTGTNAAALAERRLTAHVAIAAVPWGPPAALAATPALRALVASLRR